MLRDWLRPPPSSVPVVDDPRARRGLWIEVTLVLLVTLGLSGLRSLVSLLDSLASTVPLAEQTVAINVPQAELGYLDLAGQLLGVLRLVAWGSLGVFLLWRGAPGVARTTLASLGLDRTRPGQDTVRGAGLAAVIGVPGLGLYLVARAVGLNLTVAPTTLDSAWWTVPVLVASAFANSWAEEALVVAYLLTRLRQLGVAEDLALVLSAVLRGSYHLYQGFGGFVGNVVLGLVFGRVFQRTGRLGPLVVAHGLIDVVAFVGYALLVDRVGWL